MLKLTRHTFSFDGAGNGVIGMLAIIESDFQYVFYGRSRTSPKQSCCSSHLNLPIYVSSKKKARVINKHIDNFNQSDGGQKIHIVLCNILKDVLNRFLQSIQTIVFVSLNSQTIIYFNLTIPKSISSIPPVI